MVWTIPYPEMVLEVAMPECTKQANGTLGLYSHCGYDTGELREHIFNALLETRNIDNNDV